MSLALGCGPAQATHLETEHLSFHGELDGTCEGLERLYAREVDRIAHALGRGLIEPVDVYVGYDEVEQRCPAGTSTQPSTLAGCVISDTEVAATLDAVSLQLVQVTRDQHEIRGVPFLESTLPKMVGLARPSAGYVASVVDRSDPGLDLAAELSYGWSDAALVDSGRAAHFLHWVEQAYGAQALQAWLWSEAVREGKDVDVAFAAATGQSIAEAQARWADESALDVMFGGFCHGRPAPPLPAAGLVVEASACCDDPSVEQAFPPLLNVGSQCFTLPAEAEVTVEMLAGEGTLELRADGCSPTSPSPPLLVQPGEAATVSMTPCRWRAMVVGPERCEPGQEVRYAITPS